VITAYGSFSDVPPSSYVHWPVHRAAVLLHQYHHGPTLVLAADGRVHRRCLWSAAAGAT
jgi:hypothetical protein